MAEATVVAPTWRRIDELAALVGFYCWVENRIFEISGAWANAPARGGDAVDELDSALRVWGAGVSRRHALVAARWAERLPVRAGVDAAALVTAPPGPLPDTLVRLEGAIDTGARFGALVHTVLPGLRNVYSAHEQTAMRVSEGPVLEVLVAAQREMDGEIRGGRALLDTSAGGLTRDAVLGTACERAFVETTVFPAVHTS